MNICILGNSPHFTQIALSSWPDADIKVVSWRNTNITDNIKNNNYDLLIIAGYDYKSYMTNEGSFFHNNIEVPLQKVHTLASPNTIIIYMMTTLPKYNWTLSRYLFAKNELALQLINSHNNVKIISIPTLINNSGHMLSNKPSSKILLKLLLSFKAISIIYPSEVQHIFQNHDTHINLTIRNCKPIGIIIPRPMFIDRLMRILIG